MADPVELSAEQVYLDDALECRERERHSLGDVPAAAASPKDAVALRKGVNGILSQFRAPDEAVAFGRVDTDDDETYYVGYQLVSDEANEPLVINWQTPIGTRFYEASHIDAHGLVRRRQFTFKGASNTLEDFDDLVFADLLERLGDLVAPADLDDALLADLERSRTGEMLDIVKTIRAAQHQIIRDNLDQLLLVQGGPGTGKTAVALHRVSWLLFNHRETLSAADVAVVGPNPTFIRYIRGVLPSLGDRDVRQLALSGLGPEVRTGRREDDEVVALKGQARMAGLLDRALADRIFLPEGPLEVPAGNRSVRFDRAKLDSELDRLRGSAYAAGRNALREYLRRESRSLTTTEVRLEVLDSLLDRIWPQLTAPAFVQELLGSRERLLRAAGDAFTAREVEVLYRRSADRLSEETWSLADVPLLDHAFVRISGQPVDRYRHIVVDEAQDLSPMQLASISRRSSSGSMTILGDIAQSTGAWARDSWDDVLDALGRDRVDSKTAELEIGYRVPRQAFEFAARLLAVAAPDTRAPRVVRDGPEPTLIPASSAADRAGKAAVAAREYASRGLLVGVICSRDDRAELTHELDAHNVRWRDGAKDGIGAGINVLDPVDSKGLEFDAVVVVEPEHIAAEYVRGERLLYVALTRTTHHLSVVHVGASLPSGAADAHSPSTASSTPDTATTSDASSPEASVGHDEVGGAAGHAPRVVELLAESLASEIQEGVPEHLWQQVLQAVADRLQGPE